MAELKVNLEEGNGCYYAHTADLLGCFSKAESRSEAIDALLKDVKKYSEWLLSIGVDNEFKTMSKDFLSGINELVIIEEVTGIEKLRESHGTSALFKTDKELISEEMFEFYLMIINKLPEELLRIVFQYSDEDRNKKIIPEKPTINEELIDIYNTELFYISRFGEEVEHKFYVAINMTKDELDSLTLLERVVKVRQGAVTVLKIYYPKQHEKVFKNKKDTAFPDELWTIKKIIRKFIEYEREKINAIRALVEVLESSKTTNEESR